jgi:hypothetical protein
LFDKLTRRAAWVAFIESRTFPQCTFARAFRLLIQRWLDILQFARSAPRERCRRTQWR